LPVADRLTVDFAASFLWRLFRDWFQDTGARSAQIGKTDAASLMISCSRRGPVALHDENSGQGIRPSSDLQSFDFSEIVLQLRFGGPVFAFH